MSDPTSTGFDLDDEVNSSSSDDNEFEVDEFEGLDTEDVEGEPVSDEGGETEAAKPGRKRRDEDGVDPSEFAFDATPRPRQPGSGAKKEPGQKRNFQDVPEGWVTPTGLRHLLFDERIANTTSQAMYGFVKNGKDFPYRQHVDGRFIVPVEDATAKEAGDTLVNGPSEIGGKTWVIQAFQRRAERRAKAEAEAEKAAAAATEDQPVDEDAPVSEVVDD